MQAQENGGSVHAAAQVAAAAAAGSQKARLQWTPDLHGLFLRAVAHLGGPDKVSPKGIVEYMNVEGLTIYHVKSHLQKHRLQLKATGGSGRGHNSPVAARAGSSSGAGTARRGSSGGPGIPAASPGLGPGEGSSRAPAVLDSLQGAAVSPRGTAAAAAAAAGSGGGVDARGAGAKAGPWLAKEPQAIASPRAPQPQLQTQTAPAADAVLGAAGSLGILAPLSLLPPLPPAPAASAPASSSAAAAALQLAALLGLPAGGVSPLLPPLASTSGTAAAASSSAPAKVQLPPSSAGSARIPVGIHNSPAAAAALAALLGGPTLAHLLKGEKPSTNVGMGLGLLPIAPLATLPGAAAEAPMGVSASEAGESGHSLLAQGESVIACMPAAVGSSGEGGHKLEAHQGVKAEDTAAAAGIDAAALDLGDSRAEAGAAARQPALHAPPESSGLQCDAVDPAETRQEAAAGHFGAVGVEAGAPAQAGPATLGGAAVVQEVYAAAAAAASSCVAPAEAASRSDTPFLPASSGVAAALLAAAAAAAAVLPPFPASASAAASLPQQAEGGTGSEGVEGSGPSSSGVSGLGSLGAGSSLVASGSQLAAGAGSRLASATGSGSRARKAKEVAGTAPGVGAADRSMALELPGSGLGPGHEQSAAEGMRNSPRSPELVPQLQVQATSRRGESGSQRARLQWTPDLHGLFLRAVAHLGGPDKVSPKGIVEYMNVEGLTIYHVKSHLQKHRLQLKAQEAQEAQGRAGGGSAWAVLGAADAAASGRAIGALGIGAMHGGAGVTALGRRRGPAEDGRVPVGPQVHQGQALPGELELCLGHGTDGSAAGLRRQSSNGGVSGTAPGLPLPHPKGVGWYGGDVSSVAGGSKADAEMALPLPGLLQPLPLLPPLSSLPSLPHITHLPHLPHLPLFARPDVKPKGLCQVPAHKALDTTCPGRHAHGDPHPHIKAEPHTITDSTSPIAQPDNLAVVNAGALSCPVKTEGGGHVPCALHLTKDRAADEAGGAACAVQPAQGARAGQGQAAGAPAAAAGAAAAAAAAGPASPLSPASAAAEALAAAEAIACHAAASAVARHSRPASVDRACSSTLPASAPLSHRASSASDVNQPGQGKPQLSALAARELQGAASSAVNVGSSLVTADASGQGNAASVHAAGAGAARAERALQRAREVQVQLDAGLQQQLQAQQQLMERLHAHQQFMSNVVAATQPTEQPANAAHVDQAALQPPVLAELCAPNLSLSSAGQHGGTAAPEGGRGDAVAGCVSGPGHELNHQGQDTCAGLQPVSKRVKYSGGEGV